MQGWAPCSFPFRKERMPNPAGNVQDLKRNWFSHKCFGWFPVPAWAIWASMFLRFCHWKRKNFTYCTLYSKKTQQSRSLRTPPLAPNSVHFWCIKASGIGRWPHSAYHSLPMWTSAAFLLLLAAASQAAPAAAGTVEVIPGQQGVRLILIVLLV